MWQKSLRLHTYAVTAPGSYLRVATAALQENMGCGIEQYGDKGQRDPREQQRRVALDMHTR